DRYDSGGGGVITTVQDYAKLANALSMGGLGATGEWILSPATVRLMQRNQLTPEQKKDFTWPQLLGYGYGLGVRTVTDKALAGFPGKNTEFGWGGAAGATILSDTDEELGYFYAHHMLNPQEAYYQPRLCNVVYSCLK
ncbi:MAG: serine hydrolase, partial [Clostridia bacterium]|nr:serine hydrolase [Clostridia bacterium]